MKKPLKSKKRVCNKQWLMQPQGEQKKWWNQEEDPIWVTYYCSDHQILLVGDGDFSFSLSLAKVFGSASNMVASSLDTYDEVINKYKNAKSNLAELQKLGAYLLHGVDATQMKFHPDLKMRMFDRIIFNFPHAGFRLKEDDMRMIKMHMDLVFGFFKSASHMLRANSEIHVNHKTTHPFDSWNIEKLAEQSFLILIECADFKKEDYPGYNNKRGDSYRCDDSFPLGECSTYKFIYNPRSMKNHLRRNHMEVPRQHGILPFQEIKNMEQFPAPVDLNYHPRTRIELQYIQNMERLPAPVDLNYRPQRSLFPKMNQLDHFPQTSLVPNTPQLYHYPQTSLLSKMNQLDHVSQTSLLPKMNQLDHYLQTSLLPKMNQLDYYPRQSHFPKMNEPVRPEFDSRNGFNTIPRDYFNNVTETHGIVGSSADCYHFGSRPLQSLQPWPTQTNSRYPLTELLRRTMDIAPSISHGACKEGYRNQVFDGSSSY